MKYIFANWKQHLSHSETIQNLIRFLQELPLVIDNSVTIGVAVSHESLERIVLKNKQHSFFLIGSQSCSSFYQGSFTGEVSARSLQEIGSQFVFVGHSERRIFCKENDSDIALQVKHALDAGIRPVLCIGDSLRDKADGKSLSVLRGQIYGALDKSDIEQVRKQLLIAYEPQYAIGTVFYLA